MFSGIAEDYNTSTFKTWPEFPFRAIGRSEPIAEGDDDDDDHHNFDNDDHYNHDDDDHHDYDYDDDDDDD